MTRRTLAADPDALATIAARLGQALTRAASLEQRLLHVRSAISGRIAFSTSLGLEDQAVLHAIWATGVAIDVFTLDTGRLFAETIETIAASEARYGLAIRVVVPAAASVEALTARDGALGFRHSTGARKACCEVRKVAPLDRALGGAAGWVTGLRRDQSTGRTTLPLAASDPARGLVKVNPLADWSLADLEAYIAANEVPVNPLHARGYPSIGCATCTRAIRPGEDIRAGRWWWEHEAAHNESAERFDGAEQLDGKECGLHARHPARHPEPAEVAR